MIKVTIVYPADPIGVIPGGIDTCIRDIIRSAPDDFEFSLLGATTNCKLRPVGQWTVCDLGGKRFNFFPTYSIENPEKQPKIPATIKHLLPLLINKPKHKIDVLQLHRLEPMLPYINSAIPKFAIIHQNMTVIEGGESDIRWKYLPQLYFKMEDFLIPKCTSVYCVHQQGVSGYKERYPDSLDKFTFLPTWMNPSVFFQATVEQRLQIRKELVTKYSIDNDAKLLISVGRIDKQKNPQRLLGAVNEIIKAQQKIHLLMVGDGVLREETESLIQALGINEHVTLTGLISNDDVAKYLRGSDLLVLSSNYEGMPRCVIEALGCGIPVATTDVGEVKKVVIPGINGQIAKSFAVKDLSVALINCLSNIDSYNGRPCTDAVISYTPEKVLEPLYEAYRQAIK